MEFTTHNLDYSLLICVLTFTSYYTFKKKHGYNQDTSRDYHVGDFGNIPVIQGIHFDEELVVPGDLAGLFDESPNKVNQCFFWSTLYMIKKKLDLKRYHSKSSQIAFYF